MGLLSFFKSKKKKNTANLAKERLQILIAHEHADKSRKAPDYLPNSRMKFCKSFVNTFTSAKKMST